MGQQKAVVSQAQEEEGEGRRRAQIIPDVLFSFPLLTKRLGPDFFVSYFFRGYYNFFLYPMPLANVLVTRDTMWAKLYDPSVCEEWNPHRHRRGESETRKMGREVAQRHSQTEDRQDQRTRTDWF
jgi:hypothetical protein